MESFYFLVPIALIFVAIALRFLFWALNSGQYDNLDTEAHRILFDEDPAPGAQVPKASASLEQENPAEVAVITPLSPKERPHD